MSNTQGAVLGLCMLAGVLALIIPALFRLQGRDEWYEEGWQDCRKYYKDFEPTDDDTLLLRHMQEALILYIKVKDIKRRGDIKKVRSTENLEDLKHVAWELCEGRKGD